MKIEKPQIHFLIDVFPAVTTSTATNRPLYAKSRCFKLIALIPSRSVRQMLAIVSGVEF